MTTLRAARLTPARLVPSVPTAVGGADRDVEDRYARNIRLGRPGSCGRHPSHVVTLFDNSGSMTGGNDPVGRRFLEVSLAMRLVSRACRCGRELVSVIHFDTPTSKDLVAHPLGRAGAAVIDSALEIPRDGRGISELAPSLALAENLAVSYAEHRTHLVVLSDFELFDPPGTVERLGSFPGDVTAVVMRAQPPHQLLDMGVSVARVTWSTPPGAVASAVFKALTADRVGARPHDTKMRRS